MLRLEKIMNLLPVLRIVALLEGLSFILLLFVGVPMKYLGEDESIVKILGMPHGVLFVAYVVLALLVRADEKWNFKSTFLIILSSLLPFGTFWADFKYFRKKN